MSQQLALSSLFSVLALASLCLAAAGGMMRTSESPAGPFQAHGVQAEAAPGLDG